MQFSGGPEDQKPKHKGKRSKKPTVCNDQRRQYGHCGICGSGNTAAQGVEYCEECGAEAEYLTDDASFWYLRTGVKVPCSCKKEWTYRTSGGRLVKRCRRPTRNIGVVKCLNCGAVESSYCPNNKRHVCWGHWDGRRYCKCGFRQNAIYLGGAQ